MTSWSWTRMGDRKTALFLIMSDTDDTFNFPDLHDLHPAFQSAVRKGRRCVRRQAARPCALPDRRVRQHRADSASLKSWWPPSAAVRSPPVLSCRHRASSRQSTRTTPTPSSATCDTLHLPRRQGADHAEGAVGSAGQGNHRHLQHRREPRARDVPLA